MCNNCIPSGPVLDSECQQGLRIIFSYGSAPKAPITDLF